MLELPAIDPETLRTFGDAVRERFGLAHPGRRHDRLDFRLREAMQLSGWNEPAPLFVRRFLSAGEADPVCLAVADAITNRETCFFRDVGQLKKAVSEFIPRRAGTGAHPDDPLRVLSAGCASGEEAYSLSMLLLDQPQLLWGRRVEVVGLDLSPSAIEAARIGRYRLSSVARAGAGPADWDRRFFNRDEDCLEARGLLRSVASFARANLLSPAALAPLGWFDLVVCRNVLIYFDASTLARAVQNLLGHVRPGGAMILGHPEAGMASELVSSVRRSSTLLWFSPPEGRS